MSRQKTPWPIPVPSAFAQASLAAKRMASAAVWFARPRARSRSVGVKTRCVNLVPKRSIVPFDAADIEGVDPQTEDHGVKPGPKPVFVNGISQIMP